MSKRKLASVKDKLKYKVKSKDYNKPFNMSDRDLIKLKLRQAGLDK